MIQKTKMTNKMQALFQANRGRSTDGLRIEGSAEEASIYIYDVIGDMWGVEAKDFIEEINAIRAPVINLFINSPGGDVFEARAIEAAIRRHQSKIIGYVDGVAASAATFIAIAADELHMAEGSFFMIHKAWTGLIGDADDLRGMADVLDKVDGSMAATYAKQSGIDSETVLDWMSAETWFTAAEAVEHGFATAVTEGGAVENKFDLSVYNNVPDSLKKVPANDYDAARARARRRLEYYERLAA